MDFAWNLRGFCVGFARNLILFLFEREHEGYKRFAAFTVGTNSKKCTINKHFKTKRTFNSSLRFI